MSLLFGCFPNFKKIEVGIKSGLAKVLSHLIKFNPALYPDLFLFFEADKIII
jgi:hypothetical protein